MFTSRTEVDEGMLVGGPLPIEQTQRLGVVAGTEVGRMGTPAGGPLPVRRTR